MKKLLICLFISVLSISKTYAQKEYVTGYIITNIGDTLRGQIDDEGWLKNPLTITFKNQITTEIYNTNTQLKGFGIDNKSVYVLKTFKLDLTPHQSSKLLQNSQWIISSDTTLMIKQLVRGRINLYFMNDANGKDHFLIEKQGENIQELIDHRYIRKSESGTFEIHNDAYNSQLANLCQDCSYYAGKTFKYDYLESTLSPLLIQYNTTFGDTKALITSKKEKFKANIFLRASAGTYGYHSEYSTQGLSFSESGFTTTALGVGVLAQTPFLRKKIAIRLDILYSTFSDGVRIFSTLNTPQFNPTKNNPYLSFYLSPQYSVLRNKSKDLNIYVNAGLTVDVKLSKTVADINSYSFYTGSIIGVKFGTGISYRKLDAELAYHVNDAGLSIPSFFGLSGTMQRLALTVGYRLF